MIIIPQKFRLKNENKNVYENYTRVGRDTNSIHKWFYQDQDKNWLSVEFKEGVESNKGVEFSKDTKQASLKQDPKLLYQLSWGRTQRIYSHGIEKEECSKPKPENITIYSNDSGIVIKNAEIIEKKPPEKVTSQPILRKNLPENKVSVPKSGSLQSIKKVEEAKAEDLDFTKAADWKFFVSWRDDKQLVDLTDEKIQQQLQTNGYKKFVLRDQANGKNAKFDEEMNLKTRLFTVPELINFSKIYTQALVHYNKISSKNQKNETTKQALAGLIEKHKDSFIQMMQLAPKLAMPISKISFVAAPAGVVHVIAKKYVKKYENYQEIKNKLLIENQPNQNITKIIKKLDEFFNSNYFAPKATVGSLHLILTKNAGELGKLTGNSQAVVDIAKSIVVDCFKDEYKKDCKTRFTFFKSDTYKKVHGGKLDFEDIKKEDDKGGKRKRTERVLESFITPKASK